MRADRLLSLLMLLQTRGRMTAGDLARELEVSERTIYRDLMALSASGAPVYTERGPGGGCELLESYRTTLTGLTANETQALFMLNIPSPLAQLGVSQELKSALLKLTASLPASRRPDETLARQRIHLDASWWFQADEPTPFLLDLQRAVWQDRYVRLVFRSFFGAEIEQVVAPLGLAAKANVWYLVFAREDTPRAVRVSHVLAADLLPETFERPPDFDLPAFWEAWCREFETSRPVFIATVRISPALYELLPRYFGENGRDLTAKASPPDAEGWRTLDLPFESLPAARERLLSFGRAVEILAPEALRLTVLDFARQIVDFYGERAAPVV